ncbi:MAG: glucokinase [Gammaproteobacteria bacterium RBG_16_51_14]|nr:MAG: glucokinase [Gammaproteobacteria bacterium RBG_16_51_14]
MSQSNKFNRLIADIGGTHSRLALDSPGKGPEHITIFTNRDFTDLACIIEKYLGGLDPAQSPRTAAFSIASPIAGDLIKLTNIQWEFSVSDYQSRFGLEKLHVINDFFAIALAIPGLRDGDRLPIGNGEAIAGYPVGVIGPGTGLGVAGLVPAGDDWIPIAGEGGHVTLAAVTEKEARLIELVRKEFGHVSAERLVSGPGLAILYQTLARREGKTVEPLAAPELIRRARAREDTLAVEAADTFLAMLGTVAGNLALTLGALGGIYLAGGILPRIPDLLQASCFRARFMDKGRYRPYLETIPTWLITTETPALNGLQAYLRREDSAV